MPETQPTAKTVLNDSFWNALALLYNASEDYTEVGDFIYTNLNYFVTYTQITYDDLPFWDSLKDMQSLDIAGVAFLNIGDAYGRIYKALTADYNPLENYFTDRTEHDDVSSDLTKTGTEKTQPSGEITTSTNGDREVENEGSTSVGQGTTYDEATTDPTASEFYNISKNIVKGKNKEKFTNYGTTTSYGSGNNAYKVEKSFDERTDSTTGDRDVEEHRRGNSGIFSKQDLTRREIELRIRYRVAPILVRMIVDLFNKGVW